MASLQTSTTWAPARKVTENLEIKLTDIHNGIQRYHGLSFPTSMMTLRKLRNGRECTPDSEKEWNQ